MLIILLVLLESGTMDETSKLIFLAPISGMTVFVATALFGWNIYKNA